MAELRKNDLVKLKIEGWSGDGNGVARLNGLVIFVKGALIGETGLVRVETVRKHASWGHIETLLEASPERIKPDCPHFPQCGGCQLRHMTYAHELERKRQQVQDALTRIGGQTIDVSVIHGAECPERYRNKAQFPVEPGENGPHIGFYRAGSHQVIPVEHCLLQKPEAENAAKTVCQWMRTCQVPAYDERTHTGLVRHVYVRTNRAGESLICLIINGERVPSERSLLSRLRAACPDAVGIYLNVNTRKTNVILGEEYHLLWGQEYLMDELCGLHLRLSVPSFYQVNREQAEVLYRRALAFADLHGTETVVDLYCGTGTISLVMAKRAGHVIGAEIVPEAIEDARENAERNKISNVEFICADAGEAAEELLRRGVKPDVISVDPPRKGLSLAVIDAICQMAPKRVVYVSCNPATLARDVKLLVEKGYVLEQAEAVDLFPRTVHVETVCLLGNRKYLRKPDATINISLDMKEYYEILDRKAEKETAETSGRDQPTEGKTE